MAQRGERLRIPFAGEDRADDSLARPSTEITDDIGELEVHLRQRFLHPLDAGADGVDMVAALAPVGAGHANLRGGMERVAEEPVGVQFQQPLALLHVALAPRQIFRVPGVDQIDLEAARRQDLVDRNPIDAGRLQGDGGNPALLKPLGEAVQVGRKAVKPAYGIGIPIGPNGDVMGAVADVDARGVGMDHVEPRIVGPQAASQLASLLPIQL
jgi:hypothetical protein